MLKKINMQDENVFYEFMEDVILRTPYLPNSTEENQEELLSNEQILEAIYLASPVLCQQLLNTEKKANVKLNISFYKYLSRMRTRCTPFGLFAGISVLKWGETTRIQISDDIQRKTRLDMSYLCQLSEHITKNEKVRNSLSYFPNNTLYEVGEHLRYIELQYSNNARRYQISSIERTSYLETLLEAAKNGVKLKLLAELLVDDEITEEEAYEYLFELIDNRLLVSELDPNVTGEIDYAKKLYNHLNQNLTPEDDPELIEIKDSLKEVQKDLYLLDSKITDKIAIYKRIYESLGLLGVPIQEGNLFQVDYSRRSENSFLDQSLQHQIMDALNVLRYLDYRNHESLLSTFKEKFYAKYEDREVPLQSVLDTDIGLVYGSDAHSDDSPLIDDIVLSNENDGPQNINWREQNSFMLKILIEAIKKGSREISLEDEDVSFIKKAISIEEMPNSLAAIFKIVDLEKKEILIEHFSGSSAINVLGRFAYLHPETHQIIEKIAEHESANLKSNEIYAEIIHFPEDRIGNIILRPSFFKYEIPYLTPSGLPDDQVIKLDDLFLSLKNGKFVLKSREKGYEIKPRLSTAHNFNNKSLPVYRFLCDLQAQGCVGGLSFSWASFFTTQFDFLPRIRYKSVILSPSTWILRDKDLVDFKETCAQGKSLTEFLETRQLPSKVIISEGDNELLIDFYSEICITTFLNYIKNRQSVTLKEYLLDKSQAVVTNKNQEKYNNQFIAPILKRKSAVIHGNEKNIDQHQIINNDFQPGDSWLYYKIYCGTQSADKILIENLDSIRIELIEKKIIDKFFFIRYGDPGWHVRIRFHLINKNAIGEAILIVKDRLSSKITTGLIEKIQIDTYKPEFKRYGVNTIRISESIFHVDSEFILNLLNELNNYTDAEELRWLTALTSIDGLLDDFAYTLDDKVRLLNGISLSFNNEFNMNKSIKVQMDAKYRKYRGQIKSIMEYKSEGPVSIHNLIQERSLKISELAKEILSVESRHELQVSLDDLMASYIHMHINRLMKSRQRTNELLLYYFLHKYYVSVQALAKKELTII
jgi:thiopeptide-type bacteriocin biosynthesis protein